MLKEKNTFIIELLTQSTKTGNLVWSEIATNDNRRNYYRNMTSTGEDGTKYEMEIKYSLAGDIFNLDTNPCIFLRNNNLPNGLYMISLFNTEPGVLVNLRDLVKEMYCKDLNPTSQIIEDTLDAISKGISTSEYRENKISKLLD